MRLLLVHATLGLCCVHGLYACSREEPTEQPVTGTSDTPAVKPAPTEPEKKLEEQAPEEEESEPEKSLRRLDMLGHFDAANEGLEAVIALDGESFHGAMERLQDAKPPGLEQFERFSAELRKQAEQAVEAEKPESWGLALGQIAATCGDCHQEAKRGPEPPPAPAPDDEEGLDSHMQRHQWAVERMWEGLFVPDDDAWKAGASLLEEHPVRVPGDLPAAKRPRFKKLAAQVHRMAKTAAAAPAGPGRAEQFGELVVTCGQCHQMVGATGGGP